MSTWECNTCLGRFQDPQPDGALYFHVCPWLALIAPGPLKPRPDAVNENLELDSAGAAIGPKQPGLGRRELAGAELGAYLETLGRPPAPPAAPG